MRIATSTMSNLTTKSTSSAYDTYYNVLKKITDNKNFTKVSEDIVGSSKLLKINDNISKLNEYQSNIKTAISEMDLAYDTLNGVTDELNRINTLILDASNATTGTDSAKAIAVEIEGRVESIKGYMNTQYLDNYIFSGCNTQLATYKTDDSGNVIYQGSDKENGDRNLTISEGKTMAYNITGDEIFPTTTYVDGEGNTVETNFFKEMKELCNLLNESTLDVEAIRKKIDVVNAAQTNVTVSTGTLSARVSKLDSAQTLNDSTLTLLAEKKSDIEDVDIAKAATDLSNAKTSLEASYTISQTILEGTSLLDYL